MIRSWGHGGVTGHDEVVGHDKAMGHDEVIGHDEVVGHDEVIGHDEVMGSVPQECGFKKKKLSFQVKPVYNGYQRNILGK